MKKGIALLAFYGILQGLAAQTGRLPGIRAYAWEQASLRGAKPAAIAGENGKEKKDTRQLSGNLYIYLAYDPAQNILPFRAWINGKPHRVKNERIENTPVVISSPGVGLQMNNDTLVPAIRETLVQVIPQAALTRLTIPPLPVIETDAVAGNIVVEYYWRARRYAYTIREIKTLDAVPLQ